MTEVLTRDRLASLTRDERALLFERLRRKKEGAAGRDRIPRRPPELGPIPLSFAQERLWFIDRLGPGESAYNIPLALHIEGEVSPAVLAAILGEVVRRHEALRTTFHQAAGQPVQVVAPAGSWLLPLVDLGALSEAGRAVEVRRLAEDEAARPFDLSRGPLLRATLLRLAAAEHALLLDMHHIVSDGWSMGVLVGEITALYAAVLAAAPARLPELPIQYADFAVWQRQRLQGEMLKAQIAYWRERLAGLPASLDLPTDRPRPAAPSYRGTRLQVVFDRLFARGLIQLARRCEASPYMVLLAGFQALLGRLAGAEDFAVGSPIANRHRTEVEPLIGFFVNTLVMRADLQGDPSFDELVVRVRRSTLQAYAHQDLPFERLVEELRPERHLALNPLFQVVCAMQNAPIGRMDLQGLSLSPLEFEITTSLFDLELNVWEAEGGTLLAIFTHSGDLFDRTTVRRIAGHLETLLRGAVASPERQLAELPLLADAERHQLLGEWNDIGDLHAGASLVQRFEATARRAPHAPALLAGEEILSYGELNRWANRLSHHLRRLGVGPGVTVGLCTERSAAMVAGLLAIWKAGGAYLPLDPALPPARLAFLLEDSSVQEVLADERSSALLPPHGSHLVLFGSAEIATASDTDPEPLGGPGDLAYLIYTSGTTGRPKAVMVERRHLESTLAATHRRFGFAATDRMPCVAPFSFDIFLFELLSPLLAGGVSHLMPLRPALDVEALVDALMKATLVHAVPALMRQVVDTIRRRTDRPPRLRALFVGGDVVPAELVADLRQTFPRARLWILYGPTETAILATAHPVPAEGPFRALLGHPLDGVTIDLRDRQSRLVPPGVPGEIWIGGSPVTRGYSGRDVLTAEKFAVLGGRRFFRSGDLARRLVDGTLEFLGRLDEQVKVRGFRIEPGEIESVLARHPRVAEVVALARESDKWGGKSLVAYVVPRQTGAQASFGSEAAEHVAQWQALYDDTYGRGPGNGDAAFNLQGWNSSYTGEPIPAAEMREWVDATVERLLALEHRRILEVGCGTGLLLFRLAPVAEHYAGTDFSPVALDLVRREAVRRGLMQVTMARRTADDWTGVEPGCCDLVILNSVVQYFPGVEYLLRVLEDAVRAVRPGGAVFVGDVRSLPLLEEFHTSVERYRAGDSIAEAELQRRVIRRVADEEELVLDPDFFEALKRHLPVRGVEVLRKQGRHHNELTRFRYDVVLHVGDGDAVVVAHDARSQGTLPWRSYANDPLRTRLVRALVPELRRAVRAELPDYMVPSAFVLLDSLPLTAHGKVDRAALPDPDPARAAGATPPRTPVETALAETWRDLLGIDYVGLEDNFFDLGGHSLLATRLVSCLRDSFAVDLPLRSVFENPTLADLAADVDARRANGELAKTEIRRRKPDMPAIPLSFAQERLWFLDRLLPGSPAYNIPLALIARGTFNEPALAAALDALARRQDALRTVFLEAGRQPVQVVLPFERRMLPVVDLSSLPELVRGGESRRLADEGSQRPFDLTCGPMLRATLLRLGPEEHGLLLAMHHIVSDGWSMGVLTKEIGALYDAARQGAPSPLTELPIQYADFAVWQREWLQGKELDRQLGYWRERLASLRILDLPTDHPRTSVQSFRGAVQVHAIGPEITGSLQALARRHDATLFMVLLAALQALLGRYAGQDDVVVGSAIANRTRVELEPLIGFFVNSLVLRGDLSGDPPFGELVGRARRVALEAFSHQDLPFERLVEDLRPERRLPHNPLFQVMFALQNAPMRTIELPGLTLSQVELESPLARFDLEILCTEIASGLTLQVTYSTDLFDPSTILRLGGYLTVLLAEAVADPSRRLSEIPLLGVAQRRQLLAEWNDTAAELPRDDLASLFAEQVRRRPDAVALSGTAGDLTYAELDRRAARLARRLAAAGVASEVRVALLAQRSPALVVGILGIVKAAGAYVPLDPSYPAERLAWMLSDCGADVLLVEPGLLPAGLFGPAMIDLSADPAAVDGPDPVTPLADALVYIMYTSGSTGRPKGVGVSHRNVVRLVRESGFADLGPDQVFLQLAPISFDASTLELWAPLLNGGCLAILPPGQPSLEELGEAISRFGVTSLWLAAGLFHQMVDHGLEALRPLRQLLAGGDVLSPPHVFRALSGLPDTNLINGYGPTEGTTFTCYYPITQAEPPGASVPIGRPIGNTRVYVLGPDLRPVPCGVWGELCTGGDGVSRGYLGSPGLTAERFVPDPLAAPGKEGSRLYRTGDVVRYLADGRIEFRGRSDGQVKLRGFRIELGEIEATLARHPRVAAAVVAAREDGLAGGKRLVAYLVPRETAERQAELAPTLVPELRRALHDELPDYMVPSSFVLLDSLPLTAHGKVDRSALPAPEPAGAAVATPPRTPTEIALAGIWRELLGTEHVAVEDNFFELGGHSLLATLLLSQIRSVFQVEMPLRRVFEYPNLGSLAEEIGALQPAEVTEADLYREPVRQAQLSFSQERLWFLDRLLPGSSAFSIPSPMRLRGPLRTEALERCFAEIVFRHEALRTRFVDRDGSPLQVIDPPRPILLWQIDLAALPAAARRQESERITTEEAALPFDLERGPLIRFALLRLGEEEHILLNTVHHIVSDGWSVGVFFSELTRLYEAFALGRRSPLAPLPLQYADFARWQRKWLSGGQLETQLAYWRERLAGHPPRLDLPCDRPRPTVQTFRGGAASLRLSYRLSERLKSLGLEEKASAFMILLAGFEILLQRLSGQDDVLVGIPVAGRTRPEVEELIGFFLNTLVLRTDLSGGPTFRELVREVRTTALGAYTHQDVPFEKLLEDLQPERDLSRTPLFDVFFNMLNFPPSRARLPGGLTVEPLGLAEMEAKFDLTVYAMEDEEGFLFNVVYNADLFDRSRIEEMLRQYQTLLSQAVQEPDGSIDSFSMLTREASVLLPDPKALLAEETPSLVHELFAAHARLCPQGTAVIDPEGVWTYGELHAAVDRLAGWLRANGVQPGDRVAIHAHRSAPLVWAVFAVLEAGAAFVILDPSYPPSRLARMVDLVRPRALLDIAAVGAPGPELAAKRAEIPLHRSLPGGGPAGSRALWETLPEAPAIRVRVGPDDLALVAFTSGSTGEPRGILGRHGPLSHFLPWIGERFCLSADDRHSMLSGLSHDPLQRDIFGALCTGATLCIPAPADFEVPGRLAAWMAGEEVTVSNLTPAMAQILTEPPGGGAEAPQIPSLRWAFLIGDVLTRRDVERLHRAAPRATCVNLYGTTETQRALSYHVVDRSTEPPPILPLGRGMQDCQLLVLDRAGRLAGIGEVGEIAIRSPHLARGYLGDESLTSERFVASPGSVSPTDRMYRTGDLGRYLPAGEVAFAGRADQQVKIRGFRVETGEIEAALAEQPGIREAAVVARESAAAPGDRRLVAYVVPDPERPADPVAVGEELRRRLPAYMVPAAFVALEKLPLLANGKVDRRALPEPAEDRRRAFVPPSTPTEEALAEIWRALLGAERVGAGDDFFHLGGHSLLAARVAARARDAFGIELPLPVLFQETTVSRLAAWIDRERALRPGTGPALPQIQSRRRNAGKVRAEIEGLSDEEVQDLLRRKKDAREGRSG